MDALPCIVCGKMLQREIDDYEIQPRDGIILDSHGNYGSRVFDPMNGNYLVMNLCDDCLIEAGEKGRIRSGRSYIPVQTDGAVSDTKIMRSIVGSKRCNAPFVNWTKETAEDDSMEYLTIDEVLANYDNRDYAWNLKREHFELMREEIRQIEDRNINGT